MIDLTIAVINTPEFGTVQLHNNESQLNNLEKLMRELGVTILVLINGSESEKGLVASSVFEKNYPDFKLIKSPATLKVGPARQLLRLNCSTEWLTYNDEDDDFVEDCVEALQEISDRIEKCPIEFNLVINKFRYLNRDGSFNWIAPEWYIENQLLREEGFHMYHGSSYALVGSFINLKNTPQFSWPTESDFGEDLLAALAFYRLNSEVAYVPIELFIANCDNSTLTDRIKSEDENDMDDLSSIFPLKINTVLR